ncbi:MAG TPA: LysE family translocator [Caulobacteraceae bacterium]|nr:LysE family translocator [Caulobacteraceae bacterium]
MSLSTALLAYAAAAALLTITPGLDTAMVLRTAAVEGRRQAALAALGIGAGCLAWGLAVALGLGMLLVASRTAYAVLRWAGAAYLAWLGLRLILAPRSRFDQGVPAMRRGGWWARGLLTNLLNPKVGVFYVSFLPQFVPAGVPAAPFIVLLAAIHVAMGLAWSGGLILATRPLSRWLQRRAVVRWLDRATGAVFIGFGARLAFDRR